MSVVLAARLPAAPCSPAWRFAAPAARLVLGLAAVAILWEGGVVAFGIRPFYLPRLSAILSAIAATPAAYLGSLLHTAAETLIGLAAGATFGMGMAILFFRLRVLREMVFPIFIVSQTVPVIAFGALVVLWFGNTLLAKATIAFYLTFFPVTVNTLLGLQSVDPHREALMRSFGASPGQLLLKLQWPTALPHVFVALRLASSLALVGAIVGEWFGDTTGIGVLLLQAMYNESTVGIWAAILVAALLGTGLYGAVAFLERRLVFWNDG